MNTSNALPPVIPASQPLPPTPELPLGSPDDQVTIAGPLSAAEAILRQPRRVMYHLLRPQSAKLVLSLLLVAVLSALIYGFVAGTFFGYTQLWAAPVKIAGGLLLSILICLPSLYIFACLAGAQARPADVFGLSAGALTLTTVLLIGFAPVAWVFSQSTDSVVAMGALHLLFWFISIYFGLRFLQHGFRYLNATSRAGLRVWMCIFVLVTLQMMTALRPILGRADTLLPLEKKFFVTHWVELMKGGPDAQQVPSTAR